MDLFLDGKDWNCTGISSVAKSESKKRIKNQLKKKIILKKVKKKNNGGTFLIKDCLDLGILP